MSKPCNVFKATSRGGATRKIFDAFGTDVVTPN